MRTEELEVLRMRLKSGEYDGTHIMQAWIAVEELIRWRKYIDATTVSKEGRNRVSFD